MRKECLLQQMDITFEGGEPIRDFLIGLVYAFATAHAGLLLVPDSVEARGAAHDIVSNRRFRQTHLQLPATGPSCPKTHPPCEAGRDGSGKAQCSKASAREGGVLPSLTVATLPMPPRTFYSYVD